MGYVYNQATDDEGQYALGQTITWTAFITRYGDYLRDDKERTAKHIYDTINQLTHAARDFEAHGITRPAGVNQHNALQHLRSYKATGVRDISVRHRKRKLTALFKWAWRVELFRIDKLEKLETPQIKDTKRHKPPTQNEIGLVTKQIKIDWDPDHALGSRFKSEKARVFFPTRDTAATLVLSDTGMRVGECFGIRLGDIDVEARTIKLYGTKPGDARTTIFSRGMAVVHPPRNGEPQPMTGPLGEWINLRLAMDCATDYLFVTENGGKIDPSSWGKQWDKYRAHAGIERRIRRHDLRHYASSRHDRADREVSKALMGHRTDAAHDIYDHDDVEDLRRVHDAAAPVEEMLETLAHEAAAKAAQPVEKRRRVYTQLK
jgi:site-specific recombinase XerD